MKLILQINPHPNDRIIIGKTILQFVDRDIEIITIPIGRTAEETYKNFEQVCIENGIGDYEEGEYDFTSVENKIIN